MSGDYRYNDPAVYEKWYNIEHPYPELMKESVYGLTEIYKEDVKNASIVGNPGCYTTTSILSLLPIMDSDFINKQSIIIDAKSGVTGAGRKESIPLLFCEVNESLKAYGLATHRHTSEIEQELSIGANQDIIVQFSPHLIPIKRGILETIYVNLTSTVTFDDIYKIYSEFYKDSPFVTIYKNGNLPEIKNIVDSNNIHIGFVIDERTNRLMIVSALDNLIKGAGGQAVQNMNIMFGLDETTGLPMVGNYL